jgi:hypothetical protein
VVSPVACTSPRLAVSKEREREREKKQTNKRDRKFNKNNYHLLACLVWLSTNIQTRCCSQRSSEDNYCLASSTSSSSSYQFDIYHHLPTTHRHIHLAMDFTGQFAFANSHQHGFHQFMPVAPLTPTPSTSQSGHSDGYTNSPPVSSAPPF